MHLTVVERRVSCPFCGEPINLLLDASAGGQTYVEDCQVCCQPMQVSFDVADGECVNLSVDRAA